MTQQPTFTWRALLAMLRNLSELMLSPDGRQIIAEGLSRTIRRSKMGGVLLDKVRLMADYVRDPAEPLRPKLMIGAALLYLVIPSDLIPDWIGLVGFADDFAAISYVWTQSREILMHYDDRRRRRLKEPA